MQIWPSNLGFLFFNLPRLESVPFIQCWSFWCFPIAFPILYQWTTNEFPNLDSLNFFLWFLVLECMIIRISSLSSPLRLVRPYVWLEMLQLSATDMLWYMWSHRSDKCSASGFRSSPISVLDWSLQERSSLSTMPKPTCILPQENLNALACQMPHWNQLGASATWLAR